MTQGLGQQRDGTLCEIGVFSDTALVRMPKSLSFEEAATLTCSGLTAWNALFGHPGKVVHVGDHVLVQGTGGVSIAALQLAVAAGATVVATTSNQEKSSRLKDLGASYVINYRTTKNWGQAARDLTPESRGMDHVIDIGGYATLSQSILATRPGGVLSVVGASGGFEGERPDILEVLFRGIFLRGIVVGNRQMFRNMVEFVEAKNLQPAVDDVTFELKDLKAAIERLRKGEHFSKIIPRN
ncbi:Zinc-type alcohol dehydrogenase-like protein [Colletotrichum siamense]|nr:Zinc-type alcohol dehydrogenase-like protein [Colletotrichum siamense]